MMPRVDIRLMSVVEALSSLSVEVLYSRGFCAGGRTTGAGAGRTTGAGTGIGAGAAKVGKRVYLEVVDPMICA